MTIWIDNKSGTPIYEQIVEQVKRQIFSGDLQEDEPLPSIRSLAKDLRISVITTKRAYEELERAGFIYTVAGKGSYVAAPNGELFWEENLRAIEAHLEEAVRLATEIGLNETDFLEILSNFTGGMLN